MFPEKFVSQRGIVLPVVLVMLVLMTTVVLFLSRRSTTDERLAANVRGAVTLDTAAQYVLRWCEMRVWLSPPGVVPRPGDPPPLPARPAPPATSPPAWSVAANWANAADFPPGDLAPNLNIGTAQCLIEDARAELDLVGEFDRSGGNSLKQEHSAVDNDNIWRKYRITSEVTGNTAGVMLFARAQSEVRRVTY